MAYRSLFTLPLACLTVLATIVFYSPSPTAGPFEIVSLTTTGHDYNLPDLSLSKVFVDQHAILAERSHIAAPADGHKIAYTIANQPLASWRLAADTAYRYIDPHIRAA